MKPKRSKIIESQRRLSERTQEQNHHAVRVSHAKSHGVADSKLDTSDDPDALKTATVNYLRQHDAVFEVRVQLCTDLDAMPVENANKEWKEDESPYRTVAILTLPRQEAFSDQRRAYADDQLSFCVSHSLAAHRPLGSIMRARMQAYPVMARQRRVINGHSVTEPRSIAEVPA